VKITAEIDILLHLAKIRQDIAKRPLEFPQLTHFKVSGRPRSKNCR
jgi:hypothetical protein